MARLVLRFFQNDDGTCPLIQWLDAIRPKKAKAKVLARLQLLENLGHEIRRPHADFLGDSIYELRERYINVQYRALYFFHGQGEAVITHGFTKRDAAVPQSEIDQAQKYRTIFLTDPEKYTYEE